MKEIVAGGDVLARLIEDADIKDGLSFFSRDDEFVQVGAWNYNKGVELKRHIHNKAERSVTRTQEVLVVQNGSIKAEIFSLDKRLIETVTVNAGEILVLLNSGHGYTILQDDTRVIEIKNGPYLGPEVDRSRF